MHCFLQILCHSVSGNFELGFIRCKHVIRWQHLSWIKDGLLWLAENVISQIKMQKATSVTSAATCKLIEPYNENTLWQQSEKSLGWTPYKFSVVSTYASIPSRITNVSLSIKPKASKWSTADYIVLSFLCKRAGFELRSLRHIRNFVYLTMEL